MKKLFFTISILFFTFVLFSQIINIPADFPTIQEGINAATNGDTVLVDTGTYDENLNYTGKDITVASLYLTTLDTSYVLQTVIDGNQNGSVVTFENGESENAKLLGFTITNGYSNTSGGGILCVGSSPHLEQVRILNNEAQYNGGGMLCGAFANPDLANVVIANNTAGGDGGGLYCFNNCSPVLQQVLIAGNTGLHGGGICCLESSSPVLNDVTLRNNDAYQGGGVFCANNSDIEISEGSITENEAEDFGGGLFISDAAPTISEVDILNNVALRGGGIYAGPFFEFTLDHSNITGNTTTEKGGGIYATDGDVLIVRNCTVNDNISQADGGGLFYYVHDNFDHVPELQLENTIFSGNMATLPARYGGVVIRRDGGSFGVDVQIEKCSFDNNTSSAYGGLSIRGPEITFEIVNSLFQYNEVTDYSAGAGFTQGCSGSVVNCLFASNTGNTGGGEWNSGGATVFGGSEVEFINCTFTGNSAYYGSALTVGLSDVTLVNSIVWGNQNNQIALVDDGETGSSLSVGYSDVQGGQDSIQVGEVSEVLWLGENIDEDPVFMNSGDHPFSLDVGSPCIDSGIPDTTGFELPSDDCIGNIRVWDGNGDNIAVIDMGPYEFGAPVGIYENDFIQEEHVSIVYPNPFNSSATIAYELQRSSLVTITIYNQMGQLVHQMQHSQSAGPQRLIWHAKNYPEGMYYYRLQIGNSTAKGKMLKVK